MLYSTEWMPAPFRSLYYGIQLIICSGSLQQVWKDLDCPAVKLRNHGNHGQKCPFGHSASRFTQSQFIRAFILHFANELISHIYCQLLFSFKQLTCVQRHSFQFINCSSFCSSVTLTAIKGCSSLTSDHVDVASYLLAGLQKRQSSESFCLVGALPLKF